MQRSTQRNANTVDIIASTAAPVLLAPWGTVALPLSPANVREDTVRSSCIFGFLRPRGVASCLTLARRLGLREHGFAATQQ